MSITTNMVGASVPMAKRTLQEQMQGFNMSEKKPSMAVSSGRATALPKADTTKLTEALARMDKGFAETIIKPAADRKAEAEQQLTALATDTTLTKPEKAEWVESLKSEISQQTFEIQRHVGTPAYEYYLLSRDDMKA